MRQLLVSNVEKWLLPHLKKSYHLNYFKSINFSNFELFNPDIPYILGFEYIYDFTEIGSLKDLLHLAIKTGKLKKIIFLSSYGVYYPKKGKYKETDFISPMNFVGLRSYEIEQSLIYFSRRYNVSIVSLRLFNHYGPYQLKPFVIPTVLEEIISKGKVNIGDVEKIRDFFYITDLLGLLDKLILGKENKLNIYNVGSGNATSIHDLIIKSQEITKGSCNIVFDACKLREEYDYDYAVADISKIKKDLNWEPKVSLEQGLSLTYQWLLGRSQR